jgi:hypothetical protein
MKLHELKNILAQHPATTVRFRLPGGDFVPVHAHVTEVARLDKRFIDCGGTLRTETHCRLQTWFTYDTDHRLTAGKLLKIFALAESVLLTDDLDVDVEHEVGQITQFPLGAIEVAAGELIFCLTERHTACLAMDKCLPPAPPSSEFSPLKFDFTKPASAGKCCG